MSRASTVPASTENPEDLGSLRGGTTDEHNCNSYTVGTHGTARYQMIHTTYTAS